MPKKTTTPETDLVANETPTPTENNQVGALADALAIALERAIKNTKPTEKKNISNRTPGDPWSPKDGSKKLKLKRKAYQHGILLDPDFMNNDTIALWNQLKPGAFCGGHIRVYKRKDGGMDIDYPIKTASQRMLLQSKYRIFSQDDLLRLLIEESKKPKVEVEDDDL